MLARICALAALMALTLVAAQDPTTSLPDAYKVRIRERLTSRWCACITTPAPSCRSTRIPRGTTVYVYLNDSEGVVFTHVGGSNRTVTRPAVKAGAIRIAAGPEEHHTAENTHRRRAIS